MSEIELGPCPFCGVEDESEMANADPDGKYVYCRVCGASGGIGEDEKEAAQNWNTRPLEDAAIARAERAEAAWLIDETIQADGTLRPSLSDTLARLAKVEAENAELRDALKAANEDAATLAEFAWWINPNDEKVCIYCGVVIEVDGDFTGGPHALQCPFALHRARVGGAS